MSRALLAFFVCCALLVFASYAQAVKPLPRTSIYDQGHGAAPKRARDNDAGADRDNGAHADAMTADVLTYTSPKDGSPNTREQEIREQERHDRREEALQDRMFWLTFGLGVVQISTLFVFIGTLCAGTRAARASASSAQAAEVNAGAAKVQADTAQRMLALTQRPKLIVRNVTIAAVQPLAVRGKIELFEPKREVICRFHVANVGGSNANITKYLQIGIPIKGALPMMHPYDGNPGSTSLSRGLKPGESMSMECKNQKEIGDEGPRIRNSSDLWGFYVMGWIDYADDLGVVRRTAFCRRWDATKGRMVPVDNPDYEHAD